MIDRLLRTLKRALVLIIGLVVVYVAVWKIFPFFDHRIPIALALFLTYVFTAYILLPAIVRVYRIFFRPNHIPLYCVTPDGFASDPINIGLIGTRVQIVKSMTEAGWYRADDRTLKNMFRLAASILLSRPYPNAPFSSLYLFGRKQDLGFELPIDGSSSNRHHVRFWACEQGGPEDFRADVKFWQRIHRPRHIKDHRQFWIGSASKDTGIIPIRHNAQLTHMISPETNAERDLIVNDLQQAGHVAHTRTVKVGAPYELRNRTIGGFFRADGKMTICTLKD